MQLGQANAGVMQGVIPRSISSIFVGVETLKSQGWEYTVKLSVVEVVQEVHRFNHMSNESGLLTCDFRRKCETWSPLLRPVPGNLVQRMV